MRATAALVYGYKDDIKNVVTDYICLGNWELAVVWSSLASMTSPMTGY